MTAMDDLLARCHRVGGDTRNTNYAGGNASTKAEIVDPATGVATRVMYVKGSGGDLGTLTASGLAALDLSRLEGLVGVYLGPAHEDEMVGLFDHCLFGRGGAAPSIDTAMHALVGALHVDHLHPDSIIAFATAVDGPELTRRCFGDEVRWVDWRRPGFQLGLDIKALHDAHPNAIGCVLGGHGLTTWGATSDECGQRSLSVIRRAEAFIATNGRSRPFGSPVVEWQPLEPAARRERAAALMPQLGAGLDRHAYGGPLHRQRWRPGSRSSRGPGRVSAEPIALRLAAEGACVIVADLNTENAAAVAAEIGNADRAIAVTADVTSAEQIAAAFRAACLAFGGVDLVVNNAGCRFPNHCSKRPSTTGTCSTM